MLSKIFKLLSFSLFTFYFLLISPVLSRAQDTGWEITDFHSDINIAQNTVVDVTETITVDFHELDKHGIYRLIPIKYATKYGNRLNIRPQNIAVTDGQGQSIPFERSISGDDLKLKIGSADTTISGVNTYVIHYQVREVITRPYEAAELYWNVTGNGWPVPILSASTTVTAPPNSIKDTICFKGYYGSSDQDCHHSTDVTSAAFSALNLESGEGLTIAVSLDPSQLIFPTPAQKLLWFIADNWFFATPILTLAIMLRLYWTRGRDRQFKNLFSQTDAQTVPLFDSLNSMTVYAPPKELTPGEVGTLIDEKVNMSDITASVIDLARRGFITIKEIPKKGWFSKTDYEFILTGKDETALHDFEKSLLNLFFGTSRDKSVKLSKLKTNSYQYLEKAQSHLYDHLTREGYFSGNPQNVRILYLIIGIVIAGSSFFLTPVLGPYLGYASVIFGLVGSGLIIAGFSFFMPARTPKGRRALQEVVGLKEWVRLGAWREQIHEKHNFFEEVLPFAIALGLTEKFIKAFEDTKIPKPDWYQGSGSFNALTFNHSLNSMSRSMSTGIAASRPSSASSGGSGFSGGGSGGGFGGGGGGSW